MSNLSNPITGGAGFNLAGQDAGAGIDGYVFMIPAPMPALPAARNYDASEKAFTENQDGTFEAIDPVDQLVQMLLTIPDGKIPAMRGQCADYRTRLIGVPPGLQQTNVCTDETKRVLAPLISAGDVTLDWVLVLSNAPVQAAIFVTYTNNRTGEQKTVSAPPVA